MKIKLDAAEIKVAVIEYVQRKYGWQIDTPNLNVEMERHGQYDDATYTFDGFSIIDFDPSKKDTKKN